MNSEYPKKIVFIVNSKEDEMDLFELLYKHNVKIKQINSYELDFSEMVRCD